MTAAVTAEDAGPVEGVAPRRSAAVWIWAALGLAFGLIQAVVWLRFAAWRPEQLTRFRDPSVAAAKWARLFELAQLGWLAATVTVVGREVARQRRLTRNAMLLVAFASVVWLDPLLNYLRPGFYFTSNYTNVESWVSFIPGQLAPYASLTPVPWLWVVGTYVGMFLPVTLATARVMVRAKARFPRARLVHLIGIAWLVAAPVDLALELSALRTGTFAYPAAWHHWAIWGGRTYQFPLIELVAAPGFWVACATLVSCTDRRGLSPVERGAEAAGTPRRAAVARQLALVGYVNLVFLALPLGITQIGPARTDPFPAGYPAHLSGGWCGDAGQPYGPCPGPGVPWAVRAGRDHRHASEIYDTFGYFTSTRSHR
ncbi:MAG TPA: spirocyclase AveC family protein [Acidimicrobiia bacterium]|nr:spirocyclase AveC family protein [Acidimicrobiia bacterium]